MGDERDVVNSSRMEGATTLLKDDHDITSLFSLQVDVWNRTAEVDLSNYMPNGEWELQGRPKIVRDIKVRRRKKGHKC